MTLQELPQRLQNCISNTAGECWVYTKKLNQDGYGRIYWNGRQTMLHRITYELHVGKINSRMEIDHLCRNRACCNPSHLEQVTHKVNMERGLKNGGKKFREMTHCKYGHPFDEKNTYWRKDMKRGRICRKCRNVSATKSHKKKKYLHCMGLNHEQIDVIKSRTGLSI